jgi:4-hydroxy-tetrahydrodipicolinate reductase
MNKKIRVVQYGVGPIGAGVVRLMLQKPELQIVGAVDVDPEKVGKDLGRVAGLERDLGVQVSASLQPLLKAGVDVIVHTTGSYLEKVVGQLEECIRARAHVVSTCEELSYPFRKHPELSRRLDKLASEHGVAVLGTGVNPGFAMDKMVLTLASACQKVEKVQVKRVVNASKRRLPLQKKVGAGMTTGEFRAQVNAGVIKHHGLPESVGMLADSLAIAVARIEESIDPVVATEVTRSEYIEVPAGRVLGVRQVAHGYAANGEENITLTLEMYLGAPDSVDSIHIQGTPELKMDVPGGIHGDLATAAIAVNCIPAALEVKPGLRIAKDIPMCFFPGMSASKSQGA